MQLRIVSRINFYYQREENLQYREGPGQPWKVVPVVGSREALAADVYEGVIPMPDDIGDELKEYIRNWKSRDERKSENAS